MSTREPAVSTARERLAARQAQVLDALLAGDVPDGFDERTAIAAGAQLRSKRRYEAVTAVPELRALPDLADAFDAWARAGARPSCACADARAFVADLASRRRLPQPLRSWWLATQVYDHQRRLALITRNGRRELLVGLGTRVAHLAFSPEKSPDPIGTPPAGDSS